MRFWIFYMSMCWLSFATPPNVVVSIKPIHSLVCGIMKGIETPVLLMTGGDSPHHHSLTPQEMNLLSSADLIIWIGDAYETKLKKPIAILNKPHVLTLLQEPEIQVLPSRSGGLWVAHTHCSHDESSHHHPKIEDHNHESISQDGHLWLNPSNAKAITQRIAQALAQRDPQHAARYLANSEALMKKLDALDEEIKKKIQGIRSEPYFALHDSTQYFDHHYGTRAMGSLVEEPGQEPRPQHINQIIQALKTKKAVAFFTEPSIKSVWVKRIKEDTQAKIGTLDYIGVTLSADEEAYFTMMRQLVTELVQVLSSSN